MITFLHSQNIGVIGLVRELVSTPPHPLLHSNVRKFPILVCDQSHPATEIFLNGIGAGRSVGFALTLAILPPHFAS